ncbi:MAG: hypothetical protein ACM3NV_10930 [Syntrophothermus sp.]
MGLLLLGVFGLASAGPAAAISEPTLISPPTISGVAQVGKVLTTTDSVWGVEGFRTAPNSRVWDRCTGPSVSDCEAIMNNGNYEDLTSYTVTPADLGAMIRVWNGLNIFEWRMQVWSNPTAVVTNAPPPPTGNKPSNTALPKIKGRAEVGIKLTVSHGSWSGSTPISYKYQWKHCNAKGKNCKAIKGATKSSFTPGRKYIGTRLKVAVTARNSVGKTTATSKASEVISA